jgi:hypothetical protein
MLALSSYVNNLIMPTFLQILQSEHEAHKNSKLTRIDSILLVCFCALLPLIQILITILCQIQPQNFYTVSIYKLPLTEFVLVLIIFIQNFAYAVQTVH